MSANLAFAQVAAEYDATGHASAIYVDGDELLLRISGGQSTDYHHDGLGSVTVLTDDSGNPVQTYSYDAWGNGVEGTGTDANPYRYAGERFDADTGLIYLRARWYDPNVGRFVAPDPWTGRNGLPVSLNKYLYTNADPIDGRDPSGLLLDTGSTLIVAGIQNSIRVTNVSIGTRVLLSAALIPIVVGIRLLTSTEIENARRNGRLNVMRLQLQQGLHLHYWGKDVPKIEPDSVTKADIYDLLKQLAVACDVDDECIDRDHNVSFPGRLSPALGSAIVRMSKWVTAAQGPIFGTRRTIHQEYVDDSRIKNLDNRPRVDLEQVVGTNFRR